MEILWLFRTDAGAFLYDAPTTGLIIPTKVFWEVSLWITLLLLKEAELLDLLMPDWSLGLDSKRLRSPGLEMEWGRGCGDFDMEAGRWGDCGGVRVDRDAGLGGGRTGMLAAESPPVRSFREVLVGMAGLLAILGLS